MKVKWKKLLGEWKLWLVVILLVSSLLAIHPFTPTNGVQVEGVKSPAPNQLTVGDVIIKLNSIEVMNLSHYNELVSELTEGEVVRLIVREELMPYSYQEKVIIPYRAVIKDNKTSIGLTVGEVDDNNLEYGLELEGGIKVLLQPVTELEETEAENLVEILKQRLNLFGLKEVPINYVKDLSGNQYIRIEFAGASEEDVELLLEKEGNFEARIGNNTAFTGEDITDVCISGVECTMSVQPVYVGSGESQQVMYAFQFQIDINEESANRFANLTNQLSVGDCGADGCYLEENLQLYLDDDPIQDGDLRLPESIKGESLTSASIRGMRSTMSEATNEMRRLQAILQSRSLPVELEIISVETLSPTIGRELINNLLTTFMTAILVVSLIIGLRYKSLKVSLPIITIVIIEVISTLGVASMIGWTMDLPSLAGILASVGTGLDDQIIITDEILGEKSGKRKRSVKERIKKAFFVVITAFTATFVSMIPLAFAGAGVLKGFAITTLIGITIGVLITRPAYARICELIYKD